MQQSTPLEIKLVLHYACSIKDHDWIRSGARAVDGVMTKLVERGLLFYNMNKVLPPSGEVAPLYVATDLAKAYVKMLCETPLPVKQYVDPRFLTE